MVSNHPHQVLDSPLNYNDGFLHVACGVLQLFKGNEFLLLQCFFLAALVASFSSSLLLVCGTSTRCSRCALLLRQLPSLRIGSVCCRGLIRPASLSACLCLLLLGCSCFLFVFFFRCLGLVFFSVLLLLGVDLHLLFFLFLFLFRKFLRLFLLGGRGSLLGWRRDNHLHLGYLDQPLCGSFASRNGCRFGFRWFGDSTQTLRGGSQAAGFASLFGFLLFHFLFSFLLCLLVGSSLFAFFSFFILLSFLSAPSLLLYLLKSLRSLYSTAAAGPSFLFWWRLDFLFLLIYFFFSFSRPC